MWLRILGPNLIKINRVKIYKIEIQVTKAINNVHFSCVRLGILS